MSHSKIYIGPAGWSYADWKGIFYPPKLPASMTELSYLADFFNLVEINVTFYRIPAVKMVKRWLSQVNTIPDFRFVCKMFQNFTHRSGSLSATEINHFKTAIAPLQEAGRLLTLLIQFPWSFKNNPASRERLNQLIDSFSEFNLAVEIRHSSWNVPPFIQFLRDKQISFVNIDQPVIGKSLELTNHQTTNLVYYRFHGRNYDNWFASEADQRQRYDYLYSETEQNSLMEIISRTLKSENVIIIVFNNHFRGQALANALQMKFYFEKQPQPVPETMLKAYPHLAAIKADAAVGENLDLFGNEM